MEQPGDANLEQSAKTEPGGGHLVVRDAIGRELHVTPGRPVPFGVSETRRGLNFAIFSRHATAMTLVLFASGRHDPVLEQPLDGTFHRTGDIWHVEVGGLETGTRYGWRADRQPGPMEKAYRFDPSRVLIDPYATALTGGSRWAHPHGREGEPSHTSRVRRRSLYAHDEFDWDLVRPPRIPLSDKVIYELHVRGHTFHPSSGVAHPGTYEGLIEKIPYLKELGVTTIELLPVYEFDENENHAVNPLTGERLLNYWGYSPICFFAPKAAYAVDGRAGSQLGEFKRMVRELHRAGLEVFLDVVFNHTAEGAGRPGDPTYSFRGLDNPVYYLLDPETGQYEDYSGCGNTMNCNHPVVRSLIIDALRYWVAEMHVDGFRFDLASILGRGRGGEVLANPPLLERIAYDPVLADSMLIAEAWDAAGLYQVGSFPAWRRWAEWNGPFRDDVRRFVRGDPGLTASLAQRLSGSADLFQRSGRRPCHSVNFVTCHDGFTLADLVSYNRKHNQANGEDNRDGASENLSWNCGREGLVDDPAILALRGRQMRNFLTILMLSQGTPMLLGGDELGRTQGGNNNAYCQDNQTSWMDWTLLDKNRDLFRFTKTLIAFRRAHPVLRHPDFLTSRATPGRRRPDVTWHGVHLGEPDFTAVSRTLAMHLAGDYASTPDCDIYLAVNSWMGDLDFELPTPPPGTRWVRVVDTAAPPPQDIAEEGTECELTNPSRLLVRARSCVVLRSRRQA
jgi:isoamylase